MKLNKTLPFIFLFFLFSIPANSQTVFSFDLESNIVSYEKIEDTKYQPKYSLSLKTEDYFTNANLSFRKRGTSQNEILDTYYSLNGGTSIDQFGFRGKVLRAENENVSDFTLFQIETFRNSSGNLNIYPTYEFRYYDRFGKSLNNLSLVVTKKSGLLFNKLVLTYEFETVSITPTISQTIQFSSRHNFNFTAASDNYYYALNPFGKADFYSPLDEKYITGSWGSKFGDRFIELRIEGGYLDQPLFGDSFFFGGNIHFNLFSK